MIVRIMGEGQFDVADDRLGALDLFDDRIEAALAAGDEAAFRVALTGLLDKVRELGGAVPVEVLEPSGLILPAADAHVDEVRALLKDGGLIPG
ncbi:PspA-associated protein PspAA [Yinghuangia seranimata]|uniref:PspA-associated protein PspAA n=1 Tax=Yinghuangia seranimata TaxID=408067 RepID=UPI00248BB276|nr:hypothetical protein [Yinghuangia seranimata]MDI2131165.1 hypothetical protein [Yinghuangia seranimata]